MNRKTLFLSIMLTLALSSCTTVSKSGKDKAEPKMEVQLEVSSLQAIRIQEQGVLGIEDGDELTMLYTINAYDEKGDLVEVNNGFWGTRTHQQGAVINQSEFDKIKVSIPANGKVLIAFSLIEIDDYHGERKVINVKRHTNAVQSPKRFSRSNLKEDQELLPLEIISQSLDIAGYDNFITKQVKVSTNDYLGGTKLVLQSDDLTKIASGSKKGTETYRIDGSQVNENYLYELRYDIDVKNLTNQKALKE